MRAVLPETWRMLKITTIHHDRIDCLLKLEGKLLADWVSELYDAYRAARRHSNHLQLDLSGLSFVDAPGIVALRELIRQGVSVKLTSPFVGELLKEI